MRRYIIKWLVAGFCTAGLLLVIWLVLNRVETKEIPQEGSTPTDSAVAGIVRIYAPMAGNEEQGRKRNPSFAALADFVEALPQEVRLEWVPVRRAFQQFSQARNSCIYDMKDRARLDTEGHLLTQPLSISRFWLYGRADVPQIGDVRRIGTITGAELFFDPVDDGTTEWVYASSYEALIAMLETGRVDAVTLGPGIMQGAFDVPENFVRESEEPFLTIHGVLRCKDTADTRKIVDAFRTGWGEPIDNN